MCDLSETILKEYDKLIAVISKVPSENRCLKLIDGTGSKVSVSGHHFTYPYLDFFINLLIF